MRIKGIYARINAYQAEAEGFHSEIDDPDIILPVLGKQTN